MFSDRIKKLMAIANRSREVEAAIAEADAALAAANAKFISGGVTGTGAPQNVAHGLGVVPSAVLIIAQTTAGAFTITEGVHTSTNVVMTVTAGVVVKVLAFV